MATRSKSVGPYILGQNCGTTAAGTKLSWHVLHSPFSYESTDFHFSFCKISGGTGITPFYQLLHSVFETHDTSFNARFTLLHGSTSQDFPPSNMIQSLTTFSQKYPDRFKFHLFSDSTNNNPESHSLNIRRGRIDKSAVQGALQLTHNTSWWRRLVGPSAPTPGKSVLVLVCGPER